MKRRGSRDYSSLLIEVDHLHLLLHSDRKSTRVHAKGDAALVATAQDEHGQSFRRERFATPAPVRRAAHAFRRQRGADVADHTPRQPRGGALGPGGEEPRAAPTSHGQLSPLDQPPSAACLRHLPMPPQTRDDVGVQIVVTRVVTGVHAVQRAPWQALARYDAPHQPVAP